MLDEIFSQNFSSVPKLASNFVLFSSNTFGSFFSSAVSKFLEMISQHSQTALAVLKMYTTVEISSMSMRYNSLSKPSFWAFLVWFRICNMFASFCSKISFFSPNNFVTLVVRSFPPVSSKSVSSRDCKRISSNNSINCLYPKPNRDARTKYGANWNKFKFFALFTMFWISSTVSLNIFFSPSSWKKRRFMPVLLPNRKFPPLPPCNHALPKRDSRFWNFWRTALFQKAWRTCRWAAEKYVETKDSAACSIFFFVMFFETIFVLLYSSISFLAGGGRSRWTCCAGPKRKKGLATRSASTTTSSPETVPAR